jgi:GTP-binding protein HflX
MAQDLLFATLDPTMRAIRLPGIDKAILSDTVGFVSDLPTQLIAAFRATLEEVVAADLILHVRDIAHPDSEAQRDDVLAVLGELGISMEPDEDAPSGEWTPPRIMEVWNKIDLLSGDYRTNVAERAARRPDTALISAATGEGVDELLLAMRDRLVEDLHPYQLALSPADGAALAWLHEHGEVLAAKPDDMGHSLVDVRLSSAEFARFQSRFGSEGKAGG